MEQPSVYEPAEYQALRSVLQPVYPLCEGLTNNMLQKAMHQVMADEELTREYLPEELLSSFSLEDYRTSLVQIHFPENEACMHRARSRLVFDEFWHSFWQYGH